MDAFRRNYRAYYYVLRITGLWPYDDSILTNIRRTLFSLIIFGCIVVQVHSITHVDITLHKLLTMLSYTFPMLLFIIRYLGFAATFDVVKTFFDNIENDCNQLGNPIELELMLKNISKSSRITIIYLGLTILGTLLLICMTVIPALFHLKYQLRMLHLLGFYLVEYNSKTDFVGIYVFVTTVIGLLTIMCTEGSCSVFSFYLCGLYEIVGYRVRTTVDKAAKMYSTDLKDNIDIRAAVDMHEKAYKSVPLQSYVTDTLLSHSYIILLLISCIMYLTTFHYEFTGTLWILNKRLAHILATDLVISYMLAIFAVVASFAVNLYRVFLAITERYSPEEIVIAALITLIHLIVMFLNNYSCQGVINTSAQVFVDTYNSEWYRIPPKSQKMLQLVLVKSTNGMKINLAGLFCPCYEGLSMMMSSSFSYFTVLLSV